MTTLASTWLALCLALCAYAWLARRAYVALPLAALLAAGVVYAPTGMPRFTEPPPGQYAVLGAKIVVEKAIYVLLDDGDSEPTYYVLPYTQGKASELQAALDAAGENGVRATVTGDAGGVSYDGEPPVRGDEDKQAERPALEVE